MVMAISGRTLFRELPLRAQYNYYHNNNLPIPRVHFGLDLFDPNRVGFLAKLGCPVAMGDW